MKDNSIPYDHNEFDHMDEDDLLKEYLILMKGLYAYDSPSGIRLRQVKLALDNKHGFRVCR